MPAKEQFAIAAGQIPAADAAGEKNIAADQEFVSRARGNRDCPGNVPALRESRSSAREIRCAGVASISRSGFDRFDLEAESVSRERNPGSEIIGTVSG